MYTSADWTVTPRPAYPADGRKVPGIYTQPADLRGELERELGRLPPLQLLGADGGHPLVAVDRRLRASS